MKAKYELGMHSIYDLKKDRLESAIAFSKDVERDYPDSNSSKEAVSMREKLLKELVKISTKNSKNKTKILVGSGLNIKNIDEIVNFTGATSFHFSGKRIKQSSMEYRKENINMGLKEFSEFEILETDENLVREVADYLSKL